MRAMKNYQILLSVVVLLVLPLFASGDELIEFQSDEQRSAFLRLSEELRCPKCQNQNLADSNSEIAEIMREVIAEEVLAGHSEAEIKDMMVDRYGEFVLYEPPRKLETAILWWGPLVLLAIAILIFVTIVVGRARQAQGEPAERVEEEQPEDDKSNTAP